MRDFQLDPKLCLYTYERRDPETGRPVFHYCQKEIQISKLPQMLKGKGVCHRHKGGQRDFNPDTCTGPCCVPKKRTTAA